MWATISKIIKMARGGEKDAQEKLYEMAKEGKERAIEALFQLLEDGSEFAFDCFISLALGDKDEYAREIFLNYLHGMVHDEWAPYIRRFKPADKSDLAQSMIKRVLENESKLKKLKGREFLAYLRKMASNWAMKKGMKEARQKGISNPSSWYHKLATEGFEKKMVSDENFEVTISSLSETDQEILRLKFRLGLTNAEIGKRLDPPLTEDAVRKRLLRAVQKLGKEKN